LLVLTSTQKIKMEDKKAKKKELIQRLKPKKHC